MILHIPKCGGVWVASAVQSTSIAWRPWRLQHDDLSQVTRPDAPPTRNVVVFVRHPVSWYRSYWRYRMAQDLRGPWPRFDRGHPTERIDTCGDPEFTVFVENCLSRRPGHVTRMFAQFTDPVREDMQVFVGKQENLCADLIMLLDSVGEKFTPSVIRDHPQQNQSQGPAVIWSDELRQRVLEAEASALVKYGYE